MVAVLFDVVQVGVYDLIRAEGIWGQGSQLGHDEKAEVCRVIMIWFSQKII
jgi:hypothetical protein